MRAAGRDGKRAQLARVDCLYWLRDAGSRVRLKRAQHLEAVALQPENTNGSDQEQSQAAPREEPGDPARPYGYLALRTPKQQESDSSRRRPARPTTSQTRSSGTRRGSCRSAAGTHRSPGDGGQISAGRDRWRSVAHTLSLARSPMAVSREGPLMARTDRGEVPQGAQADQCPATWRPMDARWTADRATGANAQPMISLSIVMGSSRMRRPVA
jgi:hypothetical protein